MRPQHSAEHRLDRTTVNGRLLVMAAVALIAAVALALIPYERDLSATGRNGIDVDVELSVSCPAAILGAFQGDGSTSDGWFNYAPNNGVAGGGLCRSGARWRLVGSLALAAGGGLMLRRGLVGEGEDAVSPS